MKTQLRSDFQQFLATQDYCTPPGRAVGAIRSARTLAQWREAESAGLVRLRAEPERESYFDVYGEPDNGQECRAICHFLELYGCWAVFSEVNHGSEGTGDDWQIADAIGMCVYVNPLDPFDNSYITDLMRAALDQIPQPGNVDELCTAL